jgi:hypothetical protein
MRTPSLDRALRTAMIVSGLSALATTGCERVRARVVEGTGFNGELCVGWSLAGSAEACCTPRNHAGGETTWVTWHPATRRCTPLHVGGPFVPPAMEG